jgi:2-keto-4-pentenoate hydratase/2-oxohepta-3-ene-1,7-dioic acid hydratase in catechol pathway
MSLEPGDVLATGTPAGVWPIVSGDELVADIDRVGTLRCDAAPRKR